MTDPVIEIVSEGLRFPEGPIAMADGSVVLVEIAAGRLTRVEPNGDKQTIAELGGGPNGAAIGPDGWCYVCNNGGFEWLDVDGMLYPGKCARDYQGGRIERVNLDTGESQVLYRECGGHPLKGPNDIVFDAAGGFWFTDTGKAHDRSVDRGGVYYATIDGHHIEEVLYPFDHPNGIGLSRDESLLYFAETMTARVWRFELGAAGKLARRPRPFDAANLLYGAPGLCGFDSLALDAAGNVCVATLFSGGISVIAPDGTLLDFVALPEPLPTNLCFGGTDLSDAFVTLSGSGRLARLTLGYSGAALNFSPR